LDSIRGKLKSVHAKHIYAAGRADFDWQEWNHVRIARFGRDVSVTRLPLPVKKARVVSRRPVIARFASWEYGTLGVAQSRFGRDVSVTRLPPPAKKARVVSRRPVSIGDEINNPIIPDRGFKRIAWVQA
jgi:hypothetical protein